MIIYYHIFKKEKTNEKYEIIDKNYTFQYNEIDFMIYGIYPAKGYVDLSTTKIRSLGKKPSIINTIDKLYILPCSSSLYLNKKYNYNELFQTDIKTYFLNNQYDHKLIQKGDVFLSKNQIQFTIIDTYPNNNGRVTNETEIFLQYPDSSNIINDDSAKVIDLQKVLILPIEESLPNRDKLKSAKELFKSYLHPYFSGRFMYVTKDMKLSIDGTEWIICDLEPKKNQGGLVTLNTIIFCDGQRLNYDTLKQQQMEDDLRLAQQLQREEMKSSSSSLSSSLSSYGHGRSNRRIRLSSNLNGTTSLISLFQTLNTANNMSSSSSFNSNMTDEQRRARMIDISNRLPANHPYRMIINALQNIENQEQPNQGIDESKIERFPTRIWTRKKNQATNNDNDDDLKEQYTCMICLSEFEEGDELTTLPCFHFLS